MKITVVGAGAAFSHKAYNQSFLVEEGNRKMLVDCGFQIPNALYDQKIDINTITDVYISHLHADHIGGLEYFAFKRYDWSKKQPQAGLEAPLLICNKGLMDDLWNKSLSGGLESMEGFDADLRTYFNLYPVDSKEVVRWEGWDIKLIQQIHVMSGRNIMPSYGLIFTKPGHKSVYFVTDSQHCSPRQMEVFYRDSDIIFQDSEFVGIDMSLEEGQEYFTIDGKNISIDKDNPEWLAQNVQGNGPFNWKRYKFGSGVHANFAQLCGWPSANSIVLSPEIKKKMWLSHYQDFVLDNKDMYGHTVDWESEIQKEGFAGLLRVGQEFEV